MRHLIKKHTSHAKSLNEIRDIVMGILKQVKEEHGEHRLGYVSGIVSSDGVENVGRNMEILHTHTETLRAQNNFPVFSAADVFDDLIFQTINAHELPKQDFFIFWKEILESGYITDIYMTPRWQESSGAKDEHQTAHMRGIRIHIV